MAAPSLTVTIEGADRDDGAVLFSDFRHFLDDLANCLRCVEDRTTGPVKLKHRITDMKAASATIELRPVPPAKAAGAGRVVYDTFKQTVRAIESGDRLDPRFTGDDLRAFRKLADPVLRGRRVRVAGVQLTTQFVANIDRALGREPKAKGTVKGRVERLNVHERHEFTLYPPIGGVPILCVFPEELFETVNRAVKRSVTVTGLLTFRPDSAYPDRVQVESIEMHPPDADLPTLGSLRGLLPNATDGKPAVEFTRVIRDVQ